METYMTVREIYELLQDSSQTSVTNGTHLMIDGWVRFNRLMGNIGFITFNDGTSFRSAQLVYSEGKINNFEDISRIKNASAISIKGIFHLTPEAQQPFEIELTEVVLVGDVDESYPMQKKRMSFEYLRDYAYLRPRTNTFQAVFRVRSCLAMAVHEFFQGQGFVYVNSPILTSLDCEGASDVFKAVVDLKKPDDFFARPVSLSGSGQLQVEPFCMAFRDVYTFAPTFRAENSNTVRHANEFWMIEPEIAFAHLDDDMALIEDFIKYIIQYTYDNCKNELEFFNSFIDKGLKERLDNILSSDIKSLSYTEGIELLQKAIKSGDVTFENNNVEWGMDLSSEHEKYLTEVVTKGPLFLTDYPKDIKSFYMKLNDDMETVAAVDLLVPGIGEVVGGSEREDDYEKLKKAMIERNMDLEEYGWYLDLRRYGGCPHAGFGVGFERLVMLVTGITNIRDVLPYPRTPKKADF